MKLSTEKELPKRKRNRLESYDYSSGGAYFITVCTENRKNLFWQQTKRNLVGEDIILQQEDIKLSPYGKAVEDAIVAIPNHYSNIKVLDYVVMPNHIHMVLFIPYDDGRMVSSPTISTVVGQMKRFSSKQIGEKTWQRSFHDHIIRDKKDYEKIAKYIRENPINWRLDCFYNDRI